MIDAEDPDKAKGEAARWVAEITLYEREFSPWQERVKKIVRRYKDERSARDLKGRYNILWSNVQTLLPAVFAKNPVPNVERRFQDDDPVGRVASDVLERCVSYFVREDEFFDVMEKVALDRLLGGRGTPWVRYVPNFKDGTMPNVQEIQLEGYQTTDDALSDSPDIESEEIKFDYINWLDYGHTWGRTWEEVRASWKKVYLTRDELKERFGDEKAKLVPLDHSPEKMNDEKVDDTLKKATIYEIWDKTNRKAIWIHKDVSEPLDTVEDPLKLKNFFPGPKPVYATLANDTLIPVPDYAEYQDQASELDELTARIRAITKAIKVAGVYDGSAEGVQRILAEGIENTLVKVDNWAVFGEKGGLKGVIDFLPIKDIAAVLLTLYDARDRVKQDLYEISGISDIVRGATNPNETLGAQEIKSNFATLRLDRMQKQMESCCRDLVRIAAEIIAEHFSLETIKAISGVHLPTMQEKQMFQQQMQMQPPEQQSQVPDKILELMDNPTWEEVYDLLRNDTLRSFRIDVETDSTIKMDQDAERQARVELLGAVGGYIQQASQVQDPDLKPLLMEMLMFGVRGFKVGKDLETTFNVAMTKMQKAAQNPQPQQPDPLAEKKMEIEANKDIEQQRIQSNEKINADKLDFEKEKLLLQIDLNAAKEGEDGMAITEEDLQRDIEHKSKKIEEIRQGKMAKEQEGQMMQQQAMMKEQEDRARSDALISGVQNLQQTMEVLLQTMMAPTKLIRDASGKAIAGQKVLN